jgi:hypothetical protein
VYDREEFSNNQWNKGVGISRCSWCVHGKAGPGNSGRPCTPRENDSSKAEVHNMDRGPIACGAFREVYKGTYTEGRRKGQSCACKFFKSGSVYEESFFHADVKVVDKAMHLIEQWNAQEFIDKHIQLNKPTVWEMQTEARGARKGQKVFVEPFIANWQKFNSNSGHINADGTAWSQVMQALSHYSYHVSSGMFVLCDLQGGIYSNGAILTDPVILSRSGDYGATDLGPDGIQNFFGYHVCTKYCRSGWTKPKDAARIFAPKLGTSMVVPTRPSRAPLSKPSQSTIYEQDYDSDDSDY